MMEKRKSSRTQVQIQTLDSASKEDDVDIESSNLIEHKKNSHERKFSTVIGVLIISLICAVIYFRGSPQSINLHTVDQQLEVLSKQEVVIPVALAEEIIDAPQLQENSIKFEQESEAELQSNPDLDAQQILKEESEALISDIRKLKSQGVVMETDPIAKEKITNLQQKLRTLVPMIYGPEPYKIEMTLQFPESMPDYTTAGPDGKIIFELGPLADVPYSTYFFLNVASNWKVRL